MAGSDSAIECEDTKKRMLLVWERMRNRVQSKGQENSTNVALWRTDVRRMAADDQTRERERKMKKKKKTNCICTVYSHITAFLIR